MKTTHPKQTAFVHRSHRLFLLACLAGGNAALSVRAASIENIIAPGTPFAVTALGPSGQLSGYFFLSEFSQNAFLWNPTGGATDLGTLGGSFSIASSLNSVGTTVGFSALVSDVEFHAFAATTDAVTDLGTLGGTFSAAVAVSDTGHIAGDSNLATDGSTFHAFAIHPGEAMKDLGTLGGTSSYTYGVNNAGWVIGISEIAGNTSLHAFLHNGVSMLDLGTLGGSSSVAIDINEAGQVAGDAATETEQNRAFLYTGGVAVNLGTLGGSFSTAVALNNSGEVTGNSTTANDEESHAFLYRGGAMLDLGSLGGGSSSASGINNRGQVVGTSVDLNSLQRAFVWENGVMTDLNSVLPPESGWELLSARFINDRQQVVGEGVFQGQNTWYLLSLSDAQPENHPPVADAGADQVLMCNRVAHLDASASSDPDGDAVTFEWSDGVAVLGSTASVDVELAAGTHVLTVRVTDSHGATTEDSVRVDVTSDVIAPTVVCPEGRAEPADEFGRASIPNFLTDLVASDNCTAAAALVKQQSPSPGSSVDCGTHVVTLTVADASGNVTTCSTTFTVVDNTSPVVRYPVEVFRRARAECQAAVPDLLDRVTATDNCTPAGQLTLVQDPAPGTLVEVGTHDVSITVTDLAGNATVCVVHLIVADVTAPKVRSVSADPTVLSPADGRMVPVTLTVEATDNCDPNPWARIVAVASNQPERVGQPTTSPDWVVTGDLTLELRAENNPRKAPRTYFVLVAVSDASSNTTLRSVRIRVPRN